jgi:hypothetical protein
MQMPIPSSRSLICLLREGWAMKSRAAARVKLAVAATGDVLQMSELNEI